VQETTKDGLEKVERGELLESELGGGLGVLAKQFGEGRDPDIEAAGEADDAGAELIVDSKVGGDECLLDQLMRLEEVEYFHML